MALPAPNAATDAVEDEPGDASSDALGCRVTRALPVTLRAAEGLTDTPTLVDGSCVPAMEAKGDCEAPVAEGDTEAASVLLGHALALAMIVTLSDDNKLAVVS